MNTIVVRLRANHPTGRRNRAGFTFTETPIAIDVNPEQFAAIEADSYLMIVTKGGALEQGFANAKKAKKEEKNEEKTVEDLTKAEIVAKLEEIGFVSNTDFNPAAKKDILIQLLVSTQEMKQEEGFKNEDENSNNKDEENSAV